MHDIFMIAVVITGMISLIVLGLTVLVKYCIPVQDFVSGFSKKDVKQEQSENGIQIKNLYFSVTDQNCGLGSFPNVDLRTISPEDWRLNWMLIQLLMIFNLLYNS